MKQKRTVIISAGTLVLLVVGFFAWRYIDTKYPPTVRRQHGGTFRVQISTVDFTDHTPWPKARLQVNVAHAPGGSFFYRTTIATDAQGHAELFLRGSDMKNPSTDVFILSLDNTVGTYDGHPSSGTVMVEMSSTIGK